mmetsp:Transcript_62434/g.201354  ORF Transcript_62434/g.201354 Transcript_62434/m.201354 type:complete len:219 (-) Transcript_62434:2-658(-)
MLFRHREELVVIHCLELPDFLVQRADVSDGLHHISGARLSFRADHASTLCDPPQRFAQVAAAADKRHLELVFVDVVAFVRHRQHLALINAVDPHFLEDLGLHKMSDADLRHHGDGHGIHNLLDHLRVRHPGHALLRPDVRGDALKRHDRASACLFCNLGLLWVHYIHDDTTLEHCRQAFLHPLRALADGSRHVEGLVPWMRQVGTGATAGQNCCPCLP